MATMSFHTRLVSELTQLDQREETAERKRRYPVNHYRLSHYLHAAELCANDALNGASREQAFTDRFTPTRGMHTVARHLGLNLNVERGQWITGEPTFADF